MRNLGFFDGGSRDSGFRIGCFDCFWPAPVFPLSREAVSNFAEACCVKAVYWEVTAF